MNLLNRFFNIFLLIKNTLFRSEIVNPAPGEGETADH